jgi:hypothetical protein
MMRWADQHRAWIESTVYFDNKTLNEWIALKFNPGGSTALYSSADKGISILRCRQPSLIALEETCRDEDIWESTKGNATYYEVNKQAKKAVIPPPQDYHEMRSLVSTFCALLFTLFGDKCDLYPSMFEVLQMIVHPFCAQTTAAFTPEVCHRITWAIIVDTRSYFDDIKLADDFITFGTRIQFPVSTMDGKLLNIKFGNKILRSNFPSEWATPEPPTSSMNGGYGRSVGGPYQQPHAVAPQNSWAALATRPVVKSGPPANWRPAGFTEERHPLIQAMMEPYLAKFWGRCSISSLLTAANKRFDSLPTLEAYPGGVCWLHAIASCPYSTGCSFLAGHIKSGDLTDTQVEEVVAVLQPGVTALLARPASPNGKRKYHALGGLGGGAGTPTTPPLQL